MKSLLLVLLVITGKFCFAQVFIEKAPIGAAAAGEYNIYGSNTLSSAISYSRIKGSPFYKEQWKKGSLYSGKRLEWIGQVRLNLATQEVHYMLNNQEFVATAENKITEVILYRDNDTTMREAAFVKDVPNLLWNNKSLTGFAQVLNEGRYQLLKYTSRIVGSADSLFGTQKRYFFKDDVRYFIRKDDMVKPIRKLDEDAILTLLPVSSIHKTWIKENHLSLKKEEDLVKFLAYYNANTDDAGK